MESLVAKFKYALSGFKLLLIDKSVLIQVGFMLIALLLAFILKFSLLELCIVMICCMFIIILEMLNTVFEKIMDFIHPDYHEKVKDIKDMAAGIVLSASIFVCIIGIILYGSHII